MDTLFFLVLPALAGSGVGVALFRAASAIVEKKATLLASTDARSILYATPISAILSATGIWLIWQVMLMSSPYRGPYPTSEAFIAVFFILGCGGGLAIGLLWNLFRAYRVVER